MTDTLTQFIGGKQISGNAPLESINPSNTRDVIAKFPDGGPEDVGKAVEAARSAFPAWSGAAPVIRLVSSSMRRLSLPQVQPMSLR